MDRLTLLALAESAPRTAVVYITPISIVRVAPSIECAQCADKWVGTTAHVNGCELYRLATREEVKRLPCTQCGVNVTLPDY